MPRNEVKLDRFGLHSDSDHTCSPQRRLGLWALCAWTCFQILQINENIKNLNFSQWLHTQMLPSNAEIDSGTESRSPGVSSRFVHLKKNKTKNMKTNVFEYQEGRG